MFELLNKLLQPRFVSSTKAVWINSLLQYPIAFSQVVRIYTGAFTVPLKAAETPFKSLILSFLKVQVAVNLALSSKQTDQGYLTHDHAFQASHIAFFGSDLKISIDDAISS